jgi:TolA-binding protein
MEIQFILLFLFCSGLIGVSDGTDSKRLLLNDPTIFQDNLNRMESMLTVLQNTVKQQTVTIQQQDSKIQQQELINKQQELINKQQESKHQQQESKHQQLELIIQQQAAAISKLKSFTSSSNSTNNN